MQMTSSLTQKGQVTIPAPIRHILGVKPYDKIAFKAERGSVKIVRTVSVVERTAGALAGPGPRLSARQERAAAEIAIAEDAVRRMGR